MISHFTEIIPSYINRIEDNPKDIEAVNNLIDFFESSTAILSIDQDIETVLSYNLILYGYLVKWYNSAPYISSHFFREKELRVIPPKATLMLWECVMNYINLKNIDIEKHSPLISSFIRKFKSLEKKDVNSEEDYNKIKHYADLIPGDVQLSLINEYDYIVTHFCRPMRLNDEELTFVLTDGPKTIPDDWILIPYKSEFDDKWGFISKKTGNVIVPPQYDAVECDGEWNGPNVWVRTGEHLYNYLGRDLALKRIGSFIKMDGVGFIPKRYGRTYYTLDRQERTSDKPITIEYGHIVKKGFWGSDIICSNDLNMEPLSDISHLEPVKVLKKYSKIAVLCACLISMVYVFVSQLIFLSDISIINLWPDISGGLRFLYIVGIPVFLIGLPVLAGFILIECSVEWELYSQEPLLGISSTYASLIQFWSIMGIIAIGAGVGFWAAAGRVICIILALLSTVLVCMGLTYQPKIHGVKLILGSRLSWIILSQIIIGSNLLLAHHVFLR